MAEETGDQVKVSSKQFKNVYGIPHITRVLYKALKSKYIVLVGTESLFTPSYKPTPESFTIVIDNFSKLRTSGVPIIGYATTPSMVHVKTAVSAASLVSNEVLITHPFYLSGSKSSARPSIQLLLEFNECKCLEDYQALQSKYVKELKDPELVKFKWLRRVINQALKPPEIEEAIK